MAARRPGFELTFRQRCLRFLLPAVGIGVAFVLTCVRQWGLKPGVMAKKKETRDFAAQLVKETPAETDLLLLESRVTELGQKRQALWSGRHWDLTAVAPLSPLALKTRFEELETKIRQDGSACGCLLPDKLVFLETMPPQDESLRQSARLLTLLRMKEILFTRQAMALEKLDAAVKPQGAFNPSLPEAPGDVRIGLTVTAVCPMRNLPGFLNDLSASGMGFCPETFKLTRLDGAGGAFRVEAVLEAHFAPGAAPELPQIQIEEEKQPPEVKS